MRTPASPAWSSLQILHPPPRLSFLALGPRGQSFPPRPTPPALAQPERNSASAFRWLLFLEMHGVYSALSFARNHSPPLFGDAFALLQFLECSPPSHAPLVRRLHNANSVSSPANRLIFRKRRPSITPTKNFS